MADLLKVHRLAGEFDALSAKKLPFLAAVITTLQRLGFMKQQVFIFGGILLAAVKHKLSFEKKDPWDAFYEYLKNGGDIDIVATIDSPLGQQLMGIYGEWSYSDNDGFPVKPKSVEKQSFSSYEFENQLRSEIWREWEEDERRPPRKNTREMRKLCEDRIKTLNRHFEFVFPLPDKNGVFPVSEEDGFEVVRYGSQKTADKKRTVKTITIDVSLVHGKHVFDFFDKTPLDCNVNGFWCCLETDAHLSLRHNKKYGSSSGADTDTLFETLMDILHDRFKLLITAFADTRMGHPGANFSVLYRVCKLFKKGYQPRLDSGLPSIITAINSYGQRGAQPALEELRSASVKMQKIVDEQVFGVVAFLQTELRTEFTDFLTNPRVILVMINKYIDQGEIPRAVKLLVGVQPPTYDIESYFPTLNRLSSVVTVVEAFRMMVTEWKPSPVADEKTDMTVWNVAWFLYFLKANAECWDSFWKVTTEQKCVLLVLLAKDPFRNEFGGDLILRVIRTILSAGVNDARLKQAGHKAIMIALKNGDWTILRELASFESLKPWSYPANNVGLHEIFSFHVPDLKTFTEFRAVFPDALYQRWAQYIVEQFLERAYGLYTEDSQMLKTIWEQALHRFDITDIESLSKCLEPCTRQYRDEPAPRLSEAFKIYIGSLKSKKELNRFKRACRCALKDDRFNDKKEDDGHKNKRANADRVLLQICHEIKSHTLKKN